MVVQEPPDKAGIEDESGKTTIEEELDDAPTVDRDLETAEKLFNTIGDQDKQFPECLKGRYQEDPYFKLIIDNPECFTNFEIKEGLIFFQSEGTRRLVVPDISIKGQLIREKIIRQGHSILAHLSGHKTLTYLRDHTGGEGLWKWAFTCWEHCRLWQKVLPMFLPDTFHSHFTCNLNICLQCDC